MTIERHYSGIECRAAGRTLTGPAIRYGDVSPTHRERFEPGAFTLDNRTRWLDLRHDESRLLAWTGGGGLELTDAPDALTVTATLPETPLHDAALTQVRDGTLKGFSVEFRAQSERRESGIRVVTGAALAGIGLVPEPSYPASTAEVRARGFSLSGRIPFGKPMTCRCHRGSCDVVKFTEDAFDEALESQRDTLLITGTFDSAMASRQKGTLKFTKSDGELKVEANLPATTAADDLAASAGSVNLLTRPVFDQDLSEYVEKDGVATYTKVHLKAVLVGASDVEGWPAATIAGKSARRSRVWL